MSFFILYCVTKSVNCNFYFVSCAVQWGQRVAWSFIGSLQYSHLRFSSGAFFGRNLFICLSVKNMQNAIIKKSITEFKKSPIAITGTPSAFASASVDTGVELSGMKKFDKSIPPISNPIGGIIMFSTNDDTIFPNAEPIITPIAMSIMFPRIAKSLNSFNIFMLCSFLPFLVFIVAYKVLIVKNNIFL